MPGLLRAGGRLRPGERPDQGPPRRRRLGDHRPEGVDVPRAVGRLVLRAVQDRGGLAAASRAVVPAGAHAAAGGRGPADRPAHRDLRVQRGVLRRRAHRGGQHPRRPRRGVAGRHGHARVRARRVHARAADRVRPGAERGRRDGAADRRDRRPGAARPARQIVAGAADHAAERAARAPPGPRPRDVDRQAVLVGVAPQAGRAGAGRPGQGRAGRGRERRARRAAAALPVQPGRHHLRRLQRDPAHRHRRTNPGPSR